MSNASHFVRSELHSAIYTGWLRHRRYSPREHAFKYRVFMMYLDLDELDQVFSKTPLWSTRFWAPVNYRREDYFGDASLPLVDCVKNKVLEETGKTVDGPVRMLTNLRHFGFIINPLTVYYCFNKQEQLQAMLLEVTNTPWKEKHQYIIPCDPNTKKHRTQFSKQHHVSPFHHMNMMYEWFSSTPSTHLTVHMNNVDLTMTDNQADNRVFDATLAMVRQDISPWSLFKITIQKPFMTLKVLLAIYWQALKLFVKRLPLHTHPKTRSANQ